MRIRDCAICLRATDYSETSQVVHFLTRLHGQVRLMAKGTKRAKSKSGGAIDLFSEGVLVYSAGGGELGLLIEFTETVARPSLRAEVVRLNAGFYMLELAGTMLAEGDPHPEVFDLLHNALARLAESDARPGAVLAYCQWRLLRHVGLLGEMKICVSCGRDLVFNIPRVQPGHGKRAVVSQVARPTNVARASRPLVARPSWPRGNSISGEIFFSSRQGGLVCGDCEQAAVEKYRLDGPTLAGMAALAAAEAGSRVSLPDSQARAVNLLLAYHAREQLGRPLRTANCIPK